MTTIGIIGLGTIGTAIADGLHQALPDMKILGTRRRREGMPSFVEPCEDNRELVRRARVVLLCVKPQQLPAIADEVRPELTPDHLLISTSAGVTLAHLARHTGSSVKIARAMPNIPCQVREGITALSFSNAWSDEQRESVVTLFEAIGKTVIVDEQLFDAVTALSGCGPAYVYVIIEALSDAGVKQGLPRDVARLLAAQTLLGSARLVLTSHLHPAELRDRVTTPAGCTIDALTRLEDGGLRSTLISAVAAAAERSAALNKA
ncbi:MAG: pyrroline-5-carboxylate reductase [Vulcanimicrobiaceae bacterium]